MAIRASSIKAVNAVRVISRIDDAVDHEASDWETYLKTYDAAYLKLLEGKTPTVFLCNFNLSAKDGASVKNALLGNVNISEKKAGIAFGDWQLAVVRSSLKEIIQPDDLPEAERLPFKRLGTGHVSDETLSLLDQLGIVQEIFSAYNALTTSQEVKGEEKN